ncbi:hypothetical protein BV898_15735 [Hypsibius exemplaris]|uniref:SET domain-containing protein n=1 Tax=Hypsibius exemplaris TaxID=2072580 RepID=A0A9X6NEH4_HYPEX|nr:hypothetical protein BV898_15735 [Hypsibius exemplaris]
MMASLTGIVPDLHTTLAWTSLPSSLRFDTSDKENGPIVRARTTIDANTVFGPLIAPRKPVTPSNPPASVLTILLTTSPAYSSPKMDSFDLSSNDACNWMKFVRFSLNGLANLRVIRRDNQLFFNAKQSIAKDAELIVCLGAKLSTDVGLFTDLIWPVWLKTLEESVVDQLERDFSYVHLGMHVHVVREILKQTGLPLEVFQTRVLQIDHTGSMFVRRLVQSEMNPATWPRLDVYMKMVLDRLIKWIDLPVGIRTTVLTGAQDVLSGKNYPI